MDKLQTFDLYIGEELLKRFRISSVIIEPPESLTGEPDELPDPPVNVD